MDPGGVVFATFCCTYHFQGSCSSQVASAALEPAYVNHVIPSVRVALPNSHGLLRWRHTRLRDVDVCGKSARPFVSIGSSRQRAAAIRGRTHRVFDAWLFEILCGMIYLNLQY